VSGRWLDLVDPTREEVLAALPVHVDPEVVETLASRSGDGREARPLIEGHGTYVFGVLVAVRPEPDRDRFLYQEIDVVATPERFVTVRKTPRECPAWEAAALLPAAEAGESVGVLFHRLVDEVAESALDALDAGYGEIDELEDALDVWPSRQVRARISALRYEFLHIRKTVAATRAAVRRIVDGRIEVGDHALFPSEVEKLFGETFETLLRATEELDIARDLLAGVRDHHASRIAEENSVIVKKLTVIASLVLVPTLIVGFYGQNFEPAFDDVYWSIGVSTGLILASTLVQVALFRWRRWI
jgi:magnesium transporter